MSNLSNALNKQAARQRIEEREKECTDPALRLITATISGAQYMAMWDEIMDLRQALSLHDDTHPLLLTKKQEMDKKRRLLASLHRERDTMQTASEGIDR